MEMELAHTIQGSIFIRAAVEEIVYDEDGKTLLGVRVRRSLPNAQPSFFEALMKSVNVRETSHFIFCKPVVWVRATPLPFFFIAWDFCWFEAVSQELSRLAMRSAGQSPLEQLKEEWKHRARQVFLHYFPQLETEVCFSLLLSPGGAVGLDVTP
jgi:hypothetical protein